LERVRAATVRQRRPTTRRTPARTPAVSFPTLCAAVGLPAPEAEHRFHSARKWRLDWAWPEQKIALEQEGGIWIQGRHSRGAGMVKDFEKYNTAAAMGWRVLKATPAQIASGDILPMLLAAFWGKR